MTEHATRRRAILSVELAPKAAAELKAAAFALKTTPSRITRGLIDNYLVQSRPQWELKIEIPLEQQAEQQQRQQQQ